MRSSGIGPQASRSSHLTTPRKERDSVEWLSGIHEGIHRSPHWIHAPQRRPEVQRLRPPPIRLPPFPRRLRTAKYGPASPGGGRASARESACRVAAGAIARQLLASAGIDVSAYVERVEETAVPFAPKFFDRTEVDASPTRCPDPETAASMAAIIEAVRKEGDTVGGTVALVGRGIPAGGEPVFDKSKPRSHMLVESAGSKIHGNRLGLHGTAMRGSAHNDAFQTDEQGQVRTATNHNGGSQGGITNGEGLPLFASGSSRSPRS